MISFLNNLLIGELPDAVGLLLFGVVMVGTSILLRRFIGEDVLSENGDTAVKERV